MKLSTLIPGLAGLALLALPVALFAQDSVELANGKVHEGRVVYADDDIVVLRTGSRDREFKRTNISLVRSLAEEHARVMSRARGIVGRDVMQTLGLAEESLDRGLEHLASVFFWRVLAAAPGDEGAHKALGHKRRGKRFVLPCDGRRYPMAQRTKLAESFDKAWEFESTHYQVRTNLPLDTAVAITLDLEYLYLEFFRLFGKEWRLYEVLDPMLAHVHADEKSYPRQGRETGYFTAEDRTLRVNASRDIDTHLLVHEAVHQLLYATSREDHARNGAIPGWLDEGLAEYLGASAFGEVGRIEFEPGRIRIDHAKRVLDAKKGIDLSRVLTLAAGDFMSSKRSLRYAQAWSLVHFLLQGPAEIRAGFHNFVRGAYSGQGSPSHFKKAMGLKERELEQLWEEHLLDLTGR